VKTLLLGGAIPLLGLVLSLPAAAAQDPQILVTLEEPADAGTYSGISNLRGWAVGPQGIDRVEISIDGVFAFDVPYGATRNDVGAQFPLLPDSDLSGFSMAYNFANLAAGPHQFIARAIAPNGDFNQDLASIQTTKFGDAAFIPPNALVSVDGADFLGSGRSIVVSGIQVQDQTYDITLRWDNPKQGFSIVQIAEQGAAAIDLRGVFDYTRTSLVCPGKVEAGTLTGSYAGSSYTFGVTTTNALGADCTFTGAKQYQACTVGSLPAPLVSTNAMAQFSAACSDPIFDLFFDNVTITSSDSFVGGGNYLGVPGGVEADRR